MLHLSSTAVRWRTFCCATVNLFLKDILKYFIFVIFVLCNVQGSFNKLFNVEKLQYIQCTSNTSGFYHDIIIDVIVFQISTDNIGLNQEQRTVIKFLMTEGVSSAESHHRLAALFKDD